MHDEADHQHHEHSASGPVEGSIQFEHEGNNYEFSGVAAPFVGHDGDSAVKLEDSGELLTIHLDKNEPPGVMHVHAADMSEEDIVEAGGRIWRAKLLE